MWDAEAVVDLAAIRRNAAALRRAAPTAALMAVVKADAYGHGLVPAARAALAGGAEWLGTAFVAEAIALRAAGIQAPTLAWMPCSSLQARSAIAQRVDLAVGDCAALEVVAAAARACGEIARVHVELDTGMGRGGCLPSGWSAFFRALRCCEREGTVRTIGIWSHLAWADSETESARTTTRAQARCFVDGLRAADAADLRPSVRHLANSAGALEHPYTHYDLVRAGISLYGVPPRGGMRVADEFGLTPAMTLVAKVAQVKTAPPDLGVSYGHTYRTSGGTSLALVPVGYADGLPRAAGNAAEVLLGGHRRRVTGRICMDQFVVDLLSPQEMKTIVPGDAVVIFGPGRDREPTVIDWARAGGTIPNEILVGIGTRVPRRYEGSTGPPNQVGKTVDERALSR